MSSSKCILGDSSGFTLLELVLSTLISSLVVGILAISLGFTLKTWEREQNRKHSDMPRMVDLMKWQMGDFDPVSIPFQGEALQLFRGDAHSLALATDYSLKAVSRGVPVVARYIFSPEEKRLYYAEIPLDPYHPEPIQEFLELKPNDDPKSYPRFFATDVAEFSLAYVGEERDARLESWEDQNELPRAVLIKWSDVEGGESSTQLVVPNFLFNLPKKDASEQGGEAF